LEQHQSVVTGVALLQSSDDACAVHSLHTLPTAMFGRISLQAITPSALAYAEIFNQCANTLFSTIIPVFTKKMIDAENRPIEKLNLWKAALRPSEKNHVLKQPRETWAMREKLDSIEMPNHPPLPTVESELQLHVVEDFNADQGADQTSMKLALV